MAKGKGAYCEALNIFITNEADSALTSIVRKVQDDHGYKRIKQAVVDGLIKVAAKDAQIVDKVLPHLPPRSRGGTIEENADKN